jgi:glycosyltransferase involved in cell wall biosynthesis
MKVLLFANDLMPFGQLPTSGGGLRCFQLMRGLQAHGVEVIASMPGFTFLAEKHFADIPAEQRESLWHWDKQDELVRRVKPDAVLFASNWDHFNLSADHDLPIVIDLHGSRLIETTMWGNPINTDHKVTVLSRADCLLAAGQRQRSYFYGWLTQAGRFTSREHFIRYIPVSLDPKLPVHLSAEVDDPDKPLIVSGGGWFPWQDQSKAIFAACHLVVTRNRGVVDLYGTPHETPNESPRERAIRGVYRQVKALAAESPRVRVRGYVGREQLIEVYRGASVALEAMQYNLERELAFTTRTIEYLWCGLPVVYNNYGEVTQHIRDYDAGWTVDPDNEADICTALDEIFSDPAAVVQKSANAQRLVRDRFTWDKTVLPLLAFLEHPNPAPKIQPILGTVTVRPSYFGPKKPTLQLPLRPGTHLRQSFVVPAEHARSIEVPLSIAENRAATIMVDLKLRTARGRIVARKCYRGADLIRQGSLSVTVPFYRRVRGGERLVLEIVLQGALNQNGDEIARVGALNHARFPLLPNEDAPDGPILALRFSQAIGRFDHVWLLSRRAFDLIRRRQGRVVVHAARRRLKRLLARARLGPLRYA